MDYDTLTVAEAKRELERCEAQLEGLQDEVDQADLRSTVENEIELLRKRLTGQP